MYRIDPGHHRLPKGAVTFAALAVLLMCPHGRTRAERRRLRQQRRAELRVSRLQLRHEQGRSCGQGLSE